MNEMEFKDLVILQMYLSNRVNYDKFIEAMSIRYENDFGYIERLWPSFRDNPILFMVGRRETEVFEYFMKEIKETNYVG